MRTLNINGTKVTLRNTFIENLFALESESEKESKNDKRTLFPDCQPIVDLSVNPYTPYDTYMWFSELFQF